MNRPRWQKILTDLWGNRTRSLLVVASIAVGLFAIGIIANLYAVIAVDMRASYQSVNPANIYVQTTDLFNEDLLSTLREIPGVRQVNGVRIAGLRVVNKDGEWESIDLKSEPKLGEMQINQLHLMQGTWPPKDGEIVVDQYKYKDLGVPLGGMVKIERSSGKIRELRLVGVVQDLTVGAYSGGGGFFHSPVQGYVTSGTLNDLDLPMPELLSGAFITVDGTGDNISQIRSVAAVVTDRLEKNGINVASSTPRLSTEHPNGYLVDAIVGVLFVLGFLVVFLSGFLITNTLQALLAQQVQQIGIMKTVGARRIQIAGVYVVLIVAFGALAFAIAMPLANRLSYVILNLLAGQLNFVLQGERIIPGVIILQAALALIMPQVAAWLPIWQGTRISVQEALSGVKAGQGTKKSEDSHHSAGDHQTGDHRPSWAARQRWLSRPLLISLRNTFRRKGRLALTLLTLTLGGAVFIATFNVQVSMTHYMDQISQYFLSDVNISLDRPYRTEVIQTLLKDVPGVKRIEGWAVARSELILADGSSGERVSLLAPPADTQLVRPVVLQGRWIEPGDENAIAVSELFLSRFPGLKVGDALKLQVNGKETKWVVVGIFQFAGKNGGYSAYVSYDYLTKLTNQPYKAVTYQIVGSSPKMTAAAQTALGKAVETRLKDAGIRVTDVTTGSYLNNIAGQGFGILTAFLLFMAVLTALVGSIGLAGTMSMNVMERTREIGVMRAIGASDRILMRLVLVEGLLIGFISYLAGALLAFPISKVMSDGITMAIFDAPARSGFTITGFAIWLVVVVVLSFLASVIPARSAARLTIREVLAYE
jgi:putative ABC transport system permease protein